MGFPKLSIKGIVINVIISMIVLSALAAVLVSIPGIDTILLGLAPELSTLLGKELIFALVLIAGFVVINVMVFVVKAKMSGGKEVNFAELSDEEIAGLRGGKRVPKIEPDETAEEHEVKGFTDEVGKTKEGKALARKKSSKGKREILPTRVSKFDELIRNKGLERGSTVLLSGGAGTGKTTFCMQSIYHAAMNGEKVIYISLEEEVDKLKQHMMNNFNWDFEKLEREGKAAIMKYDPLEIARSVEAVIVSAKEKLEIDFEEFNLPFEPDRIVIDSLSALSIAFGSTENYRRYIRYLFEKLESYNSINIVLAETEQNPKTYSRAGIEEFLADGVIVLYNIQSNNNRENAIEILKLRTSKHVKKIVPFEIGADGLEIYPDQEIFRNV